MVNKILQEAEIKMKDAYQHLLDEFKSMRTNRASAGMVEDIKVEHYNQKMPLKQLASISTPDAKSISITAWDQAAVPAIEKAIASDATLGVNPLSDGKTVHLNLPPLTQERREQIVKTLGEKEEQTHISMRNARHEALQEAKKAQNNKEITEDDYHGVEEALNDKISEYRKKIDEAVAAKKQEILEV